MIQTNSQWISKEKLLITNLSGPVDREDIAIWKHMLLQAQDEIPDGSRFKMYINLYGFKAADMEAHKAMREVVPRTLARYGFRAGYVDLFDNVELPLQCHRGIQCLAAAHVHQDDTKIGLYRERFGSETEQFFTDPLLAETWIRAVPIP